MELLRVISWCAFGAAGVWVLPGITNESVMMAIPAVSCFVAGVLFIALDRIITALDLIAARIEERQVTAANPTGTIAEDVPADGDTEGPNMTLDEISAKIAEKWPPLRWRLAASLPI